VLLLFSSIRGHSYAVDRRESQSLKVRIRLHAEGPVRPPLLALLPTGSPHPAPSIPDIRSQIVALKRLRRSPSEFRKWTPDPFYYLFALIAAF
jgi:hypothetical protein